MYPVWEKVSDTENKINLNEKATKVYVWEVI